MLNREGTQAAAATEVEMITLGVELVPNKQIVICDLPFAYAIVDTETRLPIFLGTVESVD